MEFVNHEGIRDLADDELTRSLNEDAMPAEQWKAMQREYMRREIIRRLDNLKDDMTELHKVVFKMIGELVEPEPGSLKGPLIAAPTSLAFDAIFSQVTVLQSAAAKT